MKNLFIVFVILVWTGLHKITGQPLGFDSNEAGNSQNTYALGFSGRILYYPNGTALPRRGGGWA